MAARAGLPAAVRAEHLVAASLLAAIGGAAVAGAGLWVVPGVGPNGALAGLARTSDWSDALSWSLAGAGLAGPLPALWLRARVVERRRRIERELPFVLDMMIPGSYTHLRAHAKGRNLVCRLLFEKKILIYKLIKTKSFAKHD
ncbi:hypothetical protein HGQ98_33265 [Achromobacter ruhlandii]|uniref:Uncharacterized protein n=1 Tax=Achromobacter ruhlandii TaxID=72557 RepID=A0A848NMA3_9BURK|nr:hypothetical protein [Achromobacter ruhlandii]